MEKELKLSSNLLEYPGMDWSFLREEGISKIQKMSGNIWTDYNTHDPGVTILEILCYAITDLSYRLSFDIEDILAGKKLDENKALFFSAKEVLSNNPLTITDYRRLLIDIDGVKNAWIVPVENGYKGLYNVYIELNSNSNIDKGISEQIKNRLKENRNICEEFLLDNNSLSPSDIQITTTIEVNGSADVEALKKKIFSDIKMYVSPSLKRYSLEEMLDKGFSIDEIFSGPCLENGFIDSNELKLFEKKTEFYTADLIRIIMANDGVKNVRNITINDEKWKYSLQSEYPKINIVANLTFLKGTVEFKSSKNDQDFDKEKPNEKVSKDIDIVLGEYRELSDYETIQNDFPSTYGVGEINLPDSVSLERKNQAKNFKAYLMAFDQILTNYFKQLDSFKKLFAFKQNCMEEETLDTYFSQHLPDIAWQKDFDKLYPEKVEYSEVLESAFDRKNRILDHLLAIFSEKFPDFSTIVFNDNQITAKSYLFNKLNFLAKLAELRRNRCKVDSLTEILKTKLGDKEKFKDFFIIEHIFLRPADFDKTKEDIYSFRISIIFSQNISDRKDFITSIMAEEIPAHINFKFIEITDQTQFNNLKNDYNNVLINNITTARDNILQILKLEVRK